MLRLGSLVHHIDFHHFVRGDKFVVKSPAAIVRRAEFFENSHRASVVGGNGGVTIHCNARAALADSLVYTGEHEGHEEIEGREEAALERIRCRRRGSTSSYSADPIL